MYLFIINFHLIRCLIAAHLDFIMIIAPRNSFQIQIEAFSAHEAQENEINSIKVDYYCVLY